MKTKLFRWTTALLALAGAGPLTSCVYDPYYYGGGGYGSYGGYGG